MLLQGQGILAGEVAGFDGGDGGFLAVARVDDGVVGEELQDVVDGVHQLVVVAAGQVGAADVVVIDGVARKGDARLLAVEEHGAW